jgi:hypothetical protein
MFCKELKPPTSTNHEHSLKLADLLGTPCQAENHNIHKIWRHDMNWLLVSSPLKKMKVSWGYSSQYMAKKNVPNHQPVNKHHQSWIPGKKKCCSVSIYIYGKLIDIPIFYPRLTYGINMNHLNPKPNTRKLI